MRILKIIHFLLVILLLFSCNNSAKVQQADSDAREIIDFANRKVRLPDSIKRVVCIRPSALRLVLMAG